MLGPAISLKRRHGVAGFALGCGCKDAKSVSVTASVSASPSPSPSGAGTSTTTESQRTANPSSASPTTTTDTLTLTSASSSSFVWEDAVAELDRSDDADELGATQSFSGLLRELDELEQSVASWGRNRENHRGKKPSAPPPQDRVDKKLSAPPPQDRVDKKLSAPPPQDRVDKNLSAPPREHGRKAATKSAGDSTTGAKGGCYRAGDGLEASPGPGGRAEAGLDGGVAVVKQSEDPLGDFRRSMAQMVVENGIVAGGELRGMLRRFLSLNAPRHHDAILRAFAEIWDAVFAVSVHDRVPATVPAQKQHTRRAPSPANARPPMPRTPPRHHRSPSSQWRV